MSRRFEAVLEDNAPGVVFELPFDPKQEFGQARPPVRVTIGGFTFRTTVAVYSGRGLIGVNRANREAAGVDAGDRVTVEVELDTEPREVEVPPELAEALEPEPELRAFFDGLSRQIGCLGLADRLPVVDRLDRGEGFQLFLHPVGDPVENARAIGR